jgi:hypothetical protein
VEKGVPSLIPRQQQIPSCGSAGHVKMFPIYHRLNDYEKNNALFGNTGPDGTRILHDFPGGIPSR